LHPTQRGARGFLAIAEETDAQGPPRCALDERHDHVAIRRIDALTVERYAVGAVSIINRSQERSISLSTENGF
jgi:hypothetical protein